jgi:hypothetical protein
MNKKIITIIIILILAAIASVSVCVAGLVMIERQADKTLLKKLTLAKPGVHLSQIKEQLGTQMFERSKIEEVMEWGSVKDESFCNGKKIFWFYAVTPPCRAIEVYTDMNDVVVFSTWRQL